MSETRAAILHCPFCGEEDLFPAEAVASDEGGAPVAQDSGWECRSCLRAFSVKLLGLSARAARAPRPRSAHDQEES
ncbi:hypothetical protein CLV30_12452 [Haloactinopolyspora alba]|uniref:Insertion element protein n=1 Tax=Haloactinopolyspora alba TaxID=648780 RepID=A0A2P8DIA7_9ACTN|nr:hypothetical protein [Haloactinopolyspora alba]PSK96964.1 hypothetical protein CLV30_12452 [Haloactinopolyspora alba]